MILRYYIQPTGRGDGRQRRAERPMSITVRVLIRRNRDIPRKVVSIGPGPTND